MQRIRGAILDDLRAQDWVPRSVRSRAREVERALERLESRLQRSATDAEVAVELGISVAELRELVCPATAHQRDRAGRTHGRGSRRHVDRRDAA